MEQKLAREQALKIVQFNKSNSTDELQRICDLYPNDHIIQFLYASELAQQEKYESSITAFKKSVALDQTFYIARFQLCLLALSLERNEILSDYLPDLLNLAQENYLQAFSQALHALQQEDFEHVQTEIKRGIELNDENMALNNDMALLAQRIKQPNPIETNNKLENENINETHNSSFLLDIYKKKLILTINEYINMSYTN